ncbi:MAG: hypothetical protein A3I11_07895 [Elusimicrobia bacterium RIFCSPLOWO2_02_FULL_39_32]|nr:MAG: hypothetical protein A2034_02960 [Elusimicrobia bacterium GWA2_38_7]OGR80781.1 MAG: hypothetical protein A3B80_04900 [Elusimicrobia bacterium RIFCSPHIGHO2_02_FULL_39_36]OGR93504.1 MAG: hypothetical protein A3I11_07895 [Elusimicrobia bacterium RIFCSPLOWO2_02_FULL_39_32]OGS00850.1 MAG: hypothetical protein A3G85_08790 [Elusimicrobia bacterium RIFCSPLOWO2_12_FULL_39_28]
MKKIILLSILLGSRVLIALHAHSAHSSDLHPAHSACQICSYANKTSEKLLPFHSTILFSEPTVQGFLCKVQESRFVEPFFNSRNSRSPPQ